MLSWGCWHPSAGKQARSPGSLPCLRRLSSSFAFDGATPSYNVFMVEQTSLQGSRHSIVTCWALNSRGRVGMPVNIGLVKWRRSFHKAEGVGKEQVSWCVAS